MQRIDFYIVDSQSVRTCEALACQLTDKAHARGHRLFIRTLDQAQAERLDQLLWTFRQDSFLPHSLLREADSEPILLGTEQDDAPSGPDLLINLAPSLMSDLRPFRRIAEVACQEPEMLQAARNRFRWYREHGMDPHNHSIRSADCGHRG